ncbi:rod shape-determining protein RodA [Bacteriovorax sp. PP10]|jgi:rod shape determining protein RodA|uniref:Peptidoglycan glycosyltransferase RodA n=1 Tax=Bacteriovorax antarcticus TaxID=3088717 RepID=A0ABU5VW59_9BACT|nr:rod shape-determining protein RodA [Bacteriovorax sp. PP10]MEA9356822.1 rod shape-determining protein RodA [Bacteriovorax sp. PP10]
MINFREELKRYDYSFFGICTAIFIIGILNLYSATHSHGVGPEQGIYKTQILWFCLSWMAGIVVSFIQPKNFYRLAYPSYLICIMFLIMVLFVGHSALGGQRWIGIAGMKFQPSELVKMSVVLVLARWYAKASPEQETGFKELIIPFLITFVPAIMVIIQPDLGTGMLTLLIFFLITFYRKLKWKTIVIIGIMGIVTGTVMYNFGLREYQKKRIITFIDPEFDAKGSGYNAIQSKIAIGSGQFFGKGFRQSSQGALNYLPENHTDFIFAIFNEEHGFVGSVFLIALYLALFYRLLWLASNVNKMFDSIVVVGVLAIFFWHTIVNMSMVSGLMPIVGIPLPLMSYGGSNLLTFGICCGVVTSISNARNLF